MLFVGLFALGFMVAKGVGVSGVRRLGSEELLLIAAEKLKRSIELTVRQLEAKKVRSDVKLRWSRSLTKQVKALVEVAEALDKIGSRSMADWDLASYLSSLEPRVPKALVSRRFTEVVHRARFSRSHGLRRY